MSALLFLLIALAPPVLNAQANGSGRPIAETDLYSFQWIADARISPDGSQVAYTHVKVNAKKDGYDTSVWLIASAGGTSRQLTAGPRDTNPRWSPDGKRLSFVRAGEKNGKPEPGQIWILPMSGGEARALTDIPKGAGSQAWAPDGRTIAFSSTALSKDFEEKESDSEPSDVRVIARAAYRSNGSGYIQFDRPSHIWTVAAPENHAGVQKAIQITSGPFAESDVTWSRDGSMLYFTSNRVREPYYESPDSDVYSVKASGGIISKVMSIDGPLRSIAVNPKGTAIAAVGFTNTSPPRSYSQPDLFVGRLQNGAAPRNLTAEYDFDVAGAVGGDQKPPRGGTAASPVWSSDGRFVLVSAAEEGRTNLKRVDAETGKVEVLTTGDHDVFFFSVSADGSRAALLISTPTNIGDIHILDVGQRKLSRITRVNDALFSQLDLSEPEMLWYKSFDGRRIQTWVQRPPGFDPKKKYPLILNIHGGPHAAYGYTFDHEFQWMAAKGYFVLYPNPRGSTTYGQEFGNIIQQRYPGDDHKDLMAGVDELIARGWVDPERLGITGGSGGGILTNWAITQTNRFKGAVSQRSIADWRHLWYTSDFTLFTPTWFKGPPWEDESLKARSPITFVKNIKTPLMLIEGEADLRTPPGAGGEQMFRALKYLRKPTVMVQFPAESHELSRSGQPRHRVERLQHIVAWMDKYVLGKDIKTYDIE
jgi:dipeptidyl aminopeptidase/acylaminoacyl peptidase